MNDWHIKACTVILWNKSYCKINAWAGSWRENNSLIKKISLFQHFGDGGIMHVVCGRIWSSQFDFNSVVLNLATPAAKAHVHSFNKARFFKKNCYKKSWNIGQIFMNCVAFCVKRALTLRKNVCACVNITEICIANVMSSVPNVVKNSKWKPLRCLAFSMKMQAE
jgi:hypothetical protein